MVITEVYDVAWDSIARPWAEYTGNSLYSDAAQIVMDLCADCGVTMGRLPTITEIRLLSKLDDRELRQAFTNLRAHGWLEYAAIGDALPAQPEPKSTQPRQSAKSLIPADLRWAVWERDNFKCRGCGRRSHLSCDHILPESKGGPTTIENLQTLCKRCNSLKGTKGPHEWQP